MFASRVRAYPSGVLFRYSVLGWVGDLNHKHWIKMERRARDKHSSLLGPFLNDGPKSFITLATGPDVIKLFMVIIYKFS
jgi:hypothetical protein